MTFFNSNPQGNLMDFQVQTNRQPWDTGSSFQFKSETSWTLINRQLSVHAIQIVHTLPSLSHFVPGEKGR